MSAFVLVASVLAPGNGLFDRSRRYSSTQKSSFGFGVGTFRNVAIGLGGILISGRKPIGGGWKFCGCGDLRAGDGDRFALFGALNCDFCGIGGGGGGPVGNTCTGIPCGIIGLGDDSVLFDCKAISFIQKIIVNCFGISYLC